MRRSPLNRGALLLVLAASAVGLLFWASQVGGPVSQDSPPVTEPPPPRRVTTTPADRTTPARQAPDAADSRSPVEAIQADVREATAERLGLRQIRCALPGWEGAEVPGVDGYFDYDEAPADWVPQWQSGLWLEGEAVWMAPPGAGTGELQIGRTEVLEVAWGDGDRCTAVEALSQATGVHGEVADYEAGCQDYSDLWLAGCGGAPTFEEESFFFSITESCSVRLVGLRGGTLYAGEPTSLVPAGAEDDLDLELWCEGMRPADEDEGLEGSNAVREERDCDAMLLVFWKPILEAKMLRERSAQLAETFDDDYIQSVEDEGLEMLKAHCPEKLAAVEAWL